MLNQFKRWKNRGERPFSLDISKILKRKEALKFSLKIKNGDKDAFSVIYNKFKKPIYNYVSFKLRSHDVAEEITQEVFLKAYRFRESFDPQYEFSTWLWTIAKNTLADWLRKNRRSPVTEEELSSSVPLEIEELPSYGLDPELALIGSEDQKAVMQMMEQLTELQKKALFMRLIHKLSYHEIGKQLNLSLSAVKSLLHRAKTALATQLRENTQLSSNVYPLLAGL